MRALPALVLAAAAAACGSQPAANVTISGRIVDAETGRPVARKSIFIHAFDDATKRQVSLRPADDDAFELTTTWPTVRLRVADVSDEYRLDEQTFTVTGNAWDGTIRLVPTHWVLLHGRLLWRDGARLRPPSEGDGAVRHAFLGIGPKHDVHAADDGSYSVRVPREVVAILTVNTSLAPSQKSLDLTAVQGDEFAHDVILE